MFYYFRRVKVYTASYVVDSPTLKHVLSSVWLLQAGCSSPSMCISVSTMWTEVWGILQLEEAYACQKKMHEIGGNFGESHKSRKGQP